MTSSPPNDTGPTTKAEFDAELAALVRAAWVNDVDIRFGVDLRYDDEVSDWEVQITPLRKPSQHER